ncbi:phytoene/squalene synthase family protein [candidate division CSSED10-310 bacterium]|uniref:Phytoene/squalene synthase family protein n=1 Tax=candidate division CSSED10-310 bacterium TaxID=2855610 RepID=A0ABV6YSH4_UNCC1
MTSQTRYCLEMLPRVSRTFAPAIRILPRGLKIPVTVAYLLFRVADTIEDCDALSVPQKGELLDAYARIFHEAGSDELYQFNAKLDILPCRSHDEQLVHNLPEVLTVFHTFSKPLQTHIAFWVIEMSRGMRKYAQSAKKVRPSFLRTMKELDEYTYYVAGTVGYLLTELFSYYSRKITPSAKEKMDRLAESFGKGLQMVNIIRDMTSDLKRGQSYIPDELLQKYRLNRQSIYDQENADRVEEMLNELIRNAVKYLDQALDYILLIPKEEKRIRLFCILPLFWALRTLQKIQQNTLALLENDKIKVSRCMIHKEFIVALIHIFSNRLLFSYYVHIRKQFNSLLLTPLSSKALSQQ